MSLKVKSQNDSGHINAWILKFENGYVFVMIHHNFAYCSYSHETNCVHLNLELNLRCPQRIPWPITVNLFYLFAQISLKSKML
jgi:hypothetical protein